MEEEQSDHRNEEPRTIQQPPLKTLPAIRTTVVRRAGATPRTTTLLIYITQTRFGLGWEWIWWKNLESGQIKMTSTLITHCETNEIHYNKSIKKSKNYIFFKK
jgi:hypothetical protein